MKRILLLFLFATSPAYAEFVVSSSIIEFADGDSLQKDIELISRSSDAQYIASEVSEILNPGSVNEQRRVIEDPANSWLLVTPDKSILAAGSRKLLRFVLLKTPDENEHIYRVAIKPVIRGVENQSFVGLKVLVGYEALVIIRPAVINSSYAATRNGKILTIANTGNTNLLFQNGVQCEEPSRCPMPPVRRAYAGQSITIELPLSKPITYLIWDGKTNQKKTF